NVSGSARPFRFAKHLPEFGYLPLVVAMEPEVHSAANGQILSELDSRVEVLRARPLIRPSLTPLVQALSERKRQQSLASQRASPSAERSQAGSHAEGPTSALQSSQVRWTTQLSGFTIWSLDWYADWGLPALKLAM